MKRTLLLPAMVLGCVLAGGAVLSRGAVTVIEVRNLDRPPCLRLHEKAPETLAMVYIHSMYGVPVMERFRILQGKIVLQGVFTRHPAVVEYYGKEGWESLSALHRDLGPTVDVIRGNRGGQGFRLGDGTVLLEELGEIGDRIRIQVREMPFWRHLLSLLGSS